GRDTADLTVGAELDESAATVRQLADQVFDEDVRVDRLVGVVHHQCEQADVGLEDPDHLVELASELAVEGDAGSDHNRADAGFVLDPTQLDRKLVHTGGVTEPVPARMLVEGSEPDLFGGYVVGETHSVVGLARVDLSDLPV